MVGKVYIIGAGPGDPELITVKGMRALESSDVILHDALVSRALIERFEKLGKEIINVGKRGRHGVRQDEINELMLLHAKAGKVVARLKGGDPLIFGRCGDEIEFLRRHGIPFEIIPGVSSVNGVPAYISLPLTDRALSSSLTVISGREDLSLSTILGGTIVVMMGRDRMSIVAERLVKIGIDPETPAVAVENGTMSNQRAVAGTLRNIGEKIAEAEMSGPVLVIIGRVAGRFHPP
ncbi:MAG: uroporphyrinogen-III C-methyltransferase [Archaeoglobi archaeon]|nr:uroporphyrinogen-III C-methyltransferase [Archaeoglobi archaeon]